MDEPKYEINPPVTEEEAEVAREIMQNELNGKEEAEKEETNTNNQEEN